MQEPNFSYEEKYWSLGYGLVIGVDEVGRGAFAGPVVAGAAAVKISNIKNQKSKIQIKYQKEKNKRIRNTQYLILNTISSLGINDSKKLSPKTREILTKEINKYFHFGVGQASVAEINRLGIVKATERAMRRAIEKLKIKNEKLKNTSQKQEIFILIDAFRVKYISGVGLKNQKAIIHGDAISISIAAASIIAKVYRDNLMEKLARKYPKYHWEKNKGYGTEVHRNMIRKYGLTKLHRIQFCAKWLEVGQKFL